ncbi:uncharacterized protein GIQ15_03622 [Arthroderma uncinatum]|uniref:uncharacterized protein n=1 Tax=Arthroderma uncinatum TaxID=74035 RepID=UPI00144A52F5|nr:uncharacterized protein GIQ15_03622 [Arthroderma uncinatum]KAF3484298.1 hypothetical protein GIQ15_03622 [Arthroderma uncinatum]
MSTQEHPHPSKADAFRDIQEEEAVPKRGVDAEAEGGDKTPPRRPLSLSVSGSGAIYRPAVLALQAIVNSLDLKKEIQPEELKAVVDKFSPEEVIRLQAITWQFGTDPALVEPPEALNLFMSKPAAESRERILYLEGARKSWRVMSKHEETGREFVYKADNIRDRAIQLIRDLGKSEGCKAQSMPLPLQPTPKAEEPFQRTSVLQSDTVDGPDTRMQEYQDFLVSEEIDSGKQLAIAKQELYVPIKYLFTVQY